MKYKANLLVRGEIQTGEPGVEAKHADERPRHQEAKHNEDHIHGMLRYSLCEVVRLGAI